MGAAEINAFLTHLAVAGRVSASTQNQAFAALLFLYQKVLEVQPGRIEGVIRAQRPKRLPMVFPAAVKPQLREHARRVLAQHQRDLARGFGAASLPEAFDRKAAGASREFCGQFVFPASALCVDPRTGQKVRWHLHESVVSRAFREAVHGAGVLALNLMIVCWTLWRFLQSERWPNISRGGQRRKVDIVCAGAPKKNDTMLGWGSTSNLIDGGADATLGNFRRCPSLYHPHNHLHAAGLYQRGSFQECDHREHSAMNLCLFFALAALTPSAAPSAPPQAAMKAAADYSKAHNGQTCLVMFDGKIVFERYDNGGAADKVQMLASGSKSFVGVAAVAAVQDQIIRLDDPVCEALTEWKDDPKKAKITYRQLLTMTSGLMPGERGRAIQAPAWKEIAGKPLTGKPDEQFTYGAYHLNTFAYALERKLGKETFEEYLKRRILDPIGIKVEWRFRCEDGHPQVGGGAFMTARDWAKYGEFVRLGGAWDGKEVVDSKLLADCFRGTSQNPAYGLTWWLKKEVSAEHRKKIPILSWEWGDVANADWLPADLVAACGAGKQRLYVIPSLKLVIVRQGGLSRGFSDLEFLSLLLRGKSADK